MIHRIVVLSPGLPAVAAVAEGLPVGLIPEQRPVPTVRDDVVHVRGLDEATFLPALRTERVRQEKSLACLLPCGSIALL